MPSEFHGIRPPDDVEDDLQTGRILRQWLREIPVRPLLASYELIGRELGKGGFGSVVVGRKKHLPQQVAIKRIHPELQVDMVDQRRFVREVQLLAPLQHPNIVRIEDWGRDQDGLYIVMELVDGPNLATLVEQQGPLDCLQLLDCTRQICHALQWAHQHGIVHRDLKPANLLRDPFGVIKLADFGLARNDDELRRLFSQQASIPLYTPAYASPEQLKRNSTIDLRSDLYSLGATLFHLAQGEPDLSREFDIDELPPETRSLQPLFRGLLQKKIADRFPDVAAVLQLLAQLAHAPGPQAPKTASAPPPQRPTAPPASRNMATGLESSGIDGRCWKCDRMNSADRKFCSGCGSALREPCLESDCQVPIGVWETFCPECGADQPALRTSRQQQTSQLCQTLQQQLTQQRPDLAQATLQSVQGLLPTVRLQQLQPELSQLRTGIQQTQQVVLSVIERAEQLGATCDYLEALQSLQSIPQALWPSAAQDWQRSQRDLQQLQEQLPGLVQRGDLLQVRQVLAHLEQLQPGRWPGEQPVQQCIGVLVQRAQRQEQSGDLEGAMQCLESIPSSDRTAECRQHLSLWQQQVLERQQQAEQLAAVGDYQQALDLFADLGESRRPRRWAAWRTSLAQVQQLTVQLTQPALKFSWQELTDWVDQLQQLQPGRAFRQRYVALWLQEHQSAAEELDQVGRWDEVVTLLSAVPDGERTPVMVQLLQQIEAHVSQVCRTAADQAASGDYAQAVQSLQQLPHGLRPAVLRQYASQLKRVEDLQDQFNKALDSEQVTEAVRCLATLESLQPGRWRQDPRPGQLVERLLAECEQLLQQGQVESVDGILKRIPDGLQTDRYQRAQKNLQQQQQAEQAMRSPTFPFSASAAKVAQTAWAKRLGKPEEWTNTLGMKFRVIPAGTFLMGSPEGKGDSSERPQHKVAITKAFGLGVHTVTQGQWQKLMGSTPWSGQAYVKTGAEIAATYVSWGDAVEFCQRLSKSEGLRYRLPREAEWEWSCRAGTTTDYSFGDDAGKLGEYAWFGKNATDKNERYAHAVGQKRCNPFGLYDLHGSVWEWCQDWKDAAYYAQSPVEDPSGPASGSSRVLRGGSWLGVSALLRSASRVSYTPDYRDYDIGFRVLSELE